MAADGSGDFPTVQQALDYVPGRITINHIKAGCLQRADSGVSAGNKFTLLFLVMIRNKTILTFKLSALQAGNTHRRKTLFELRI